MELTAYPYGHVCATRGAVTGSPQAVPKLSRSRLQLGLASTSLAVGLLCGTLVFPQAHYRESPGLPDPVVTVCKPRVTLSICFRGPNREPGVGQTTWPDSKQACSESGCR